MGIKSVHDASDEPTSADSMDAERLRGVSLDTQIAGGDVVRLLALGGLSSVYEIADPTHDRRVAIKLLRSHDASDGQFEADFIRELHRVECVRHPHIVEVFSVGVHEHRPYISMPLLKGEHLGTLFGRRGSAGTSAILDLLLPIAAALAHLHDRMIVHGNITPNHIFLHREDSRTVPKLLGLGAFQLWQAWRADGEVVGTPRYMSPEQVNGRPVNSQSDQFSLALIAYEGLTGRVPQDGQTVAEVLLRRSSQSIELPADLVQVPPRLRAVLSRALSYDPAARFPSVRDFARALLPFASTEAQKYWAQELEIQSMSDETASDGASLERDSLAARARRLFGRAAGALAQRIRYVDLMFGLAPPEKPRAWAETGPFDDCRELASDSEHIAEDFRTALRTARRHVADRAETD